MNVFPQHHLIISYYAITVEYNNYIVIVLALSLCSYNYPFQITMNFSLATELVRMDDSQESSNVMVQNLPSIIAHFFNPRHFA